jgi:RNA polymerase sigma-70 factor (ECF subfamily)
MNNDESLLISGCLKGDGQMQRRLYARYSPVMYGVCLRYARDEDEAADILQDGFVKVFTRLGEFRSEGSFEGWIRRIMVNTAINAYVKNKKQRYFEDIDEFNDALEDEKVATDHLQLRDLLRLVQSLPPGYRAVFNLYEIEGFSHKEIADLMGISINTSKTQLMHARRLLQKKIKINDHDNTSANGQ